MTCKHCLEAMNFCLLSISYRAVVTILFIKDINEWSEEAEDEEEKKRKRAKIDDDGSSRKRKRAQYDAMMMIDNRRRKRVKRCSDANLLLAIRVNKTIYTRVRVLSHLILRSIAVKGKWNHTCMKKEMMRWWCVCEKDEMLTGLSTLFNYFSFSFIVVCSVHIHLYIYIH
jgi:hypothetical protein